MTKVNWDNNNIPDQKGKIVIVTGSSSGIGLQTAGVLASKNASVILAVRNLSKGTKAINEIKQKYANTNVTLMELDLANLDSIKNFAKVFKEQYSQLNLLINNAGVMIPPYSKTKDGFELQFGTNHLGHFALTGLLFNIIKSTKNSRIINVSSNAHKFGKINFDDLNWEKRTYKAWNAYGDSKIANLLFTYELHKRLKEENSTTIVAAAHPGWTATDLQRYSGIFEFMNGLFAQKIEMGALPTLYAATSENVHSGEYFGPSDWMGWRGYPKKVESNELSHNNEIAAKLWEVSEKLTGITY